MSEKVIQVGKYPEAFVTLVSCLRPGREIDILINVQSPLPAS